MMNTKDHRIAISGFAASRPGFEFIPESPTTNMPDTYPRPEPDIYPEQLHESLRQQRFCLRGQWSSTDGSKSCWSRAVRPGQTQGMLYLKSAQKWKDEYR